MKHQTLFSETFSILVKIFSKMQSPYLYPPPKKSDGDIVACVVEKTGDETRTSMRQSEIYAFSPFIRIRDGFMVMPKWNWEKFKLGDWILTKPEYAVGRDEEQRDERELTNIRKIEMKDYAKYKIPPTSLEGCTVKIRCPFVLCPDYIQYKEISNSYGRHKKLLLMNIGQGFVRFQGHNSKDFNQLQPDCVYIGVFEFQAKDNGACNFGHRSSMRDHTNHVLERDAMWQLATINRKADQRESEEMSHWLNTVKRDAEEFYRGLEQQGALKRRVRSVPRPLLEVSNGDSSMFDSTLRHPRRSPSSRRFNARRSPSSRRSNTSFKSQSESLEASNSQNLTLASNPDLSDYMVEFNSMEEFLRHRNRTIVHMYVREESGNVVSRWYDLETKQSSPDNDILYFKFETRYKVIEPPRPASRAATPIPPTQRSRTISESSVRTNTLGQPVATSTPCPSPPPSPIPGPATPRQFFEHTYGTFQSDEREEADEGNEGDELNQTSNTTLLQQDNNANPVYRTPFMRR